MINYRAYREPIKYIMKICFLIIFLFSLLGIYSYGEFDNNQLSISEVNKSNVEIEISENPNVLNEQKKSPTDFIPSGYVIFDKVLGDLNKDGIEDCVLIIKGTDKSKINKDEYQGEVDRNRRGLIILFNDQNSYELAAENYTCFSSENEDGVVYSAPELSVEIKKGNLNVSYGHGKYGYREYIFRFQNSDFELIGYNVFSIEPINNRKISLNFSTKEKREIVYLNDDEVVDDTREKIRLNRIIQLSEIKDFDELDMTEYVKL
jgi:hypothetical protein